MEPNTTPTEIKPTDSKSTDSKPATLLDTTPVETKPTDSKPTTLLDTAVPTETKPTELQKDWWTQHESLKEHDKSLSKFSSVESLAKSYVNLEKLLGKKEGLIKLPTETSAPEELAEYRKQTGVPETHEAYVEDKTKYSKFIQEAPLREFQTLAHSLNLPKKSFDAIMEHYSNSSEASLDKVVQQLENNKTKALDTLKSEHKENLQTVLTSASSFAKKHGGEEIIKDPSIANNPAMINLLYKMSKMAGEDKQSSTMSNPTNVADIDSQIQTIMADRKGAYWNTSNPNHRATVAKVKELYKLKTGEK